MVRSAVSIRGVPEWLIYEYLVELGAEPTSQPKSARMRSPDWTVSWGSERVLMPGGAFSITQLNFTFESDDQRALARIMEEFLLKTQRGGG